MRSHRTIRTIAVLASAAMVFGAFAAGPAEAKKKKKKKPAACAPFVASEPATDSGQGAEAAEAKTVQVTTAATEEKPVVIEYEHGPALWETLTQTPIQEDTVFHNFQVVGTGGLHLRMEWPGTESDIDMYLFDGSGTRVASSGAFNPVPVPGVFDAGGNGGQGFESIPGFASSNCQGFTVESRAFMTPGEPVTLKAWLGEVGSDIPE